MKRRITIYEKMLNEYERLEKKLVQIQKQIKKLPEGKLILCTNGKNNVSWFRSDGHKKDYIKKEEIALAQKLAYKKFLTIQLEEIKHEMRAIKFYLKHHLQGIPKSNQLISNSQEFQKLLSVYFTPLDQKLNDWMHAPYEKNKSYPEQLIHRTCTGEYVRSKSEAFIYTCLCKNKIPFRYECELKLGAATYHPDFTIRHPKTGKTFYWENFGLMDKREYAKNTYSKLDNYHAYGIMPTINLITTYETKEYPLSLETVERIIEDYFL